MNTPGNLVPGVRALDRKGQLELAGHLQDQPEVFPGFIVADESLRLQDAQIHTDAQVQFLMNGEVEHDATVRAPAEIGVLELLDRTDEGTLRLRERRLGI